MFVWSSALCADRWTTHAHTINVHAHTINVHAHTINVHAHTITTHARKQATTTHRLRQQQVCGAGCGNSCGGLPCLPISGFAFLSSSSRSAGRHRPHRGGGGGCGNCGCCCRQRPALLLSHGLPSSIGGARKCERRAWPGLWRSCPRKSSTRSPASKEWNRRSSPGLQGGWRLRTCT